MPTKPKRRSPTKKATPEPVPPPSISNEADATVILPLIDWAGKTWPEEPEVGPAAAPRLWLVDSNQQLLIPFLESAVVTIGRGPSSQLSLSAFDTDSGVSREHARLHFLHGRFGLEDNASTNGTWWNRVRLSGRELAPLRPGDRLIIGGLRAKFLAGPQWAGWNQPPGEGAESLTQFTCPHCHRMTLAMFSYCVECGKRTVAVPAAPSWQSGPPPEPIDVFPEPLAPLPVPVTPPPPPVDRPPPKPPPTPLPVRSSGNIPRRVTAAPGRLAPELLRSPVLDDQPSSRDYLGFASYSTALRDLILHPSTKTPLTLGIFGRWGTGKTTLMRMLEKELKDRGLVTVWFNAWQYSKEDQLWAAFLQSLLNRIKLNLRPIPRSLFDLRLLLRRVDWDASPQLALQYAVRALIALLPLAAAALAAPLLSATQFAAAPVLVGGVVSAGLAGWWILKPMIEAVRQNISIDFDAFQKQSEFQKHIAFLDSFRDHFQDIVWSLPGRGDKRLAVFIDDLDRCSPEGTLQVLDAIKLFIDIPGCAYILGVDVDVVQKAISIKYKDDPVAQREYLGKIIQLPFQLPVLTRTEMRGFVEQIAPELPDSRCREVFVEGLTANPREIKRAMSIFAMLWSLAAQRPELASIIKPVRLAKVVVIRHSYPDLHRILQEQAHLLIELELFFRQNTAPAGPATTDTAPSAESTGIKSPESALTPLLQTFAGQESLKRMLRLHPPIEGVDDETSFAHLRLDELLIYFTLTRRMETPLTPEQPESAESFPNFGSRYQVRSLLGQGGMSTVYLAFDQTRQQRVAIKVLAPSLQADPKTRARFRREIQILYRLDSPNMIRIYDDGVYTDRGQEMVYFAMEYLEGDTLKRLLERQLASSPGWLPLDQTLQILLPIIEALGYVHRLGILHRDIKPSTIGISTQGVPKLMDFGIAKAVEKSADEITKEGIPVGTPGYISPEQARGLKLDARSDLYSLGIVLYECLTGRRPFASDTPLAEMIARISSQPPPPHTLNPDIPGPVEAVILKLLATEPDGRFDSAEEVRQALLEADRRSS